MGSGWLWEPDLGVGRPGRLCGRAAYSAPGGGEPGPGEKGLPVAPEVCCGGGVQNETLVFYRAAEKGSGRRGAHLSGPVASRGLGGAERGPAGRVPGGRGARLSAQPGRLGKQHGDPAPPPPPRHPAHAPLSNQNGSSPGPGREAGPPSSPALPEGGSPHWAPGRSGTERRPLPRLERPRAEERELGVFALGGRGEGGPASDREGRAWK